MVLLAAECLPNAEIGRRVGMTRQTVIAWRARYEAGGIEALADLPRSGRPPVIDESAVMVSTLNPPPSELAVTHWSARLLADHLSKAGMPVSFAEVARIWRAWDLQPHRVETFKFSTDPRSSRRRSATSSACTWTRPRTRWWSASMRSRRSRPSTAPCSYSGASDRSH
jgi:transposase